METISAKMRLTALLQRKRSGLGEGVASSNLIVMFSLIFKLFFSVVFEERECFATDFIPVDVSGFEEFVFVEYFVDVFEEELYFLDGGGEIHDWPVVYVVHMNSAINFGEAT